MKMAGVKCMDHKRSDKRVVNLRGRLREFQEFVFWFSVWALVVVGIVCAIVLVIAITWWIVNWLIF